jgi:hypothetical protein
MFRVPLIIFDKELPNVLKAFAKMKGVHDVETPVPIMEPDAEQENGAAPPHKRVVVRGKPDSKGRPNNQPSGLERKALHRLGLRHGGDFTAGAFKEALRRSGGSPTSVNHFLNLLQDQKLIKKLDINGHYRKL